MTADTTQQVDQLLADLAEAVSEHDGTDDGSFDDDTIAELGERAADLVSATDLTTLMASIGLGDPKREESPTSLPAAIASGEARHVSALQSLLTASKLPAADDETTAELVDELQSTIETAATERATASDESEPQSTESGTEATHTETESTESRTVDDETEKANDEAEKTNDETEADDSNSESSSVRAQLQSELNETLDVFGQLPDLGDLSDSLGGDDSETDEQPTDDEESGKISELGGEDDGQSSRPSDGTRWRPGGRKRTAHATVPRSGRRDIGRVKRFSSARGSTVSKR